MIAKSKRLGRSVTRIAIVAFVATIATGCEKIEKAAGSAGIGTDTSLPESVAAIVEPRGEMMWLDDLFSTSCTNKPNSFENVGLYYKRDDEPWPRMQSMMWISVEHPLAAPIDGNVKDMFVAGVIKNLIDLQDIQYSTTNSGWGPTYCIKLVTPQLGADYSSYNNSNGEQVRGLIRVGALEFDHAEYVSTFQKTRPQGYVAEHRKFKLVAKLTEDPKYGRTSILLERDIVVFLSPEDRVWQIDRGDQTNWYQAP
jgi:hypothetical protein